MEERRRFVRLPARLSVSATILPDGRKQEMVSKDISGGGLRLFSDKPLPPGTQLQLAVTLSGRGEPVNAIGEVVWSETYEVIGRTDRQRSVEIGVRSAEIAPKDQEAVAAFVASGLSQKL